MLRNKISHLSNLLHNWLLGSRLTLPNCSRKKTGQDYRANVSLNVFTICSALHSASHLQTHEILESHCTLSTVPTQTFHFRQIFVVAPSPISSFPEPPRYTEFLKNIPIRTHRAPISFTIFFPLRNDHLPEHCESNLKILLYFLCL